MVDIGLFHRLGIAVRGEGEEPARWFEEVLGAEIARSHREPGDTHWSTVLRIGGTQIAVFAASETDTDGVIGRFVDRYGAGLHSLAWRVDDLQAAEEAVRSRGLTVTGVNRAARHWFLHPRETHGILIELTDQGVGQGRSAAPTGGPPLDVAWMTATVADIDEPRALFEELFGAAEVDGLPKGDPAVEETADLRIGDVVIRLVAPRSAQSRYHRPDGRSGLASVTLLVDSLGDVPLPVIEVNGDRAWSDPAHTLGLALEWTTVSPGWPN